MIKLVDILSEIIDPSEAYNDIDAVQTLIDGKRNLAFVVEKANNKDNWARVQKMIADNGLKAMYVKGNTNNAYVVYTPGSEAKANELKNIAETYKGYLSANATKEDTIKIGELLGYDYDKIMAFVNKNYPNEPVEEISMKKALGTAALAVGLAGSPNVAKAQSPQAQTQQQDTTTAKATYIHPNENTARSQATVKARAALATKLGKPEGTISTSIVSSKLYTLADGRYEAEVTVKQN